MLDRQILPALALFLSVAPAGCSSITGETGDGGTLASAAVDAGAPAPTVDAGASDPPIVHQAPSGAVTTLVGSDVSGAQDGAGVAAHFDNPTGIFLEPQGTLLVAESDGGRIRRVTSAGETTLVSNLFGDLQPFAVLAIGTTLYVQTDKNPERNKGATSGTLWRVTPPNAPEVLVTKLGRPRGLLLLPDAKILVADRTTHTINILNPADGTMTLLAGSGQPGLIDGIGAEASFNSPYGAALLPDGSIVVADEENYVIRRVTRAGAVTLFAGDGKLGMRDDDDKLKARFAGPVALATDPFGNVFVSDAPNHRIRRINVAGHVETLAGNGVAGFADGEPTSAEFYGQESLAITPDGKTLYVSDGNSGDFSAFHRIRRLTLP